MSQEILFEEFSKLFTARCDRYPLLDLSEDAIRYDFFTAITLCYKVEPSQIQLEVAMHPSSFLPRSNMRSNRKEKPLMDMVVETSSLNISAEFAMFKQNSNEKGTVNKTARTVKFMNDMMRLAIDSVSTGRTSYFICVADDTFLGHQLRSKLIGKFPSHYLITSEIIEKQKETKTCKFDDRFLNVFKTTRGKIKADLIFKKDIEAAKIHRMTKLLIWTVELQQ